MLIVDDVIDSPTAHTEVQSQHEGPNLEGHRIQQIVRARRAVLRTRGWYITAAIACLILAVQQVVWLIAALPRGPWDAPQTARLSLAVVLMAVAMLLRERIGRLSSELHHKSLPDPVSPPDFSSLSDGSQHARNLHNLDNKP